MVKYLFGLILSLLFASSIKAQESSYNVKIDSVNSLLSNSENSNFTYQERLNFAELASQLAEEIAIDSLILKCDLNLSYAYLNVDDYVSFKRNSYKNLNLATKLKDTLTLARANNNLGWYYHEDIKYDSAYNYYYRAVNFYNKLGLYRNEGEVLLNMGNIQQSVKDYVGSEANAVRAIQLIQSLPETENNLDTLWSLHNLIGLISLDLGLFDKSIEYHRKGLEYSNRMTENYIYDLYTSVNIALVYAEMNDYDEAIKIYEELLKDPRLYKEETEIYAYVLNNLAYVRFKNKDKDAIELREMFHEAIRVSDSLFDEERIMAISNNYAEFLESVNQKDSAYYYANKAYELGESSMSNDIVLESLSIMSKVSEGNNGAQFLNKYIKLSDSLISNERSFRNKFARIEFETDQIIAENQQISRERLIFLLSSVGLLVTLILLYVIITQRIKNKQLEFNKVQQEANEEIYNLMLAQQDKIDEAFSNNS